MKTIGLIGGMSWESSTEYYRIINEEVMRFVNNIKGPKKGNFVFCRISTHNTTGNL